MANNRHYWAEKTQRAEIATTHTQEMQREYSREITASAKKSRVYGPDAVNTHLIDEGRTPRIKILSLDSVAAIFQEAEGKSCVLNFASFKNPGGMFLAGSRAQEESLCHESFLYNVLQSRMDYYEWNRKNLNRALYKNRALYSPDILFSRQGQTKGRTHFDAFLDLSYTPIQHLPANHIVEGSLFLNGSKIKELPDNLTIGGELLFTNNLY